MTALRRLTALALLASLLGAAGSTSLRADDKPAAKDGELWEVTTQMSMEGMPMALPAHTTKVCAAKEWKEPPAMDDRQKCVSSDFKWEGSKATWKVKCAGPPAMEGTGEITRSEAAYNGLIQLKSDETTMKIKLDG